MPPTRPDRSSASFPSCHPSRSAVPALAGLVAFLGLLLSGCAMGDSGVAAPDGPQDLLLTNVHVVDVDAGAVLEDRTVAVAAGRITGVWPAAEAPEIDAGRTLDGEGRYLVPGFFDAHVHFRGGEEILEGNRALLPLYPATGVTSVRDAGGDLTEHLLAWRDSIAAGDMAGPRIYTSGPKLDGPRPSWEGSLALATPEEVPAALDSLEALGADYVKIYDGSIPADVFMAIVRRTEERGMQVSGHMPFSVPFLDAVEAGFDATEHLYYAYKAGSPLAPGVTERVAAGELGFWNALWELMEERDPALEEEVYATMAREGTAVVPTLHIGEVLAWVDEDDHQDDPELRYIPPEVEETYQGRVRSARRSSAEVRERTRRLRDEMAAMVPELRAAGVTIMAGSDAGPFNSYVYPGFSLHAEMEALVDAGLSAAEALRTATVNPAEWLGVGDEQGRVAPGYAADLVLLEGNPLEDITRTRDVSTVILRGSVVLDREALQGLLEGVAR